MKKNKRIVAIIVFGIILPIITLALMLTFESKHINSLKREYRDIAIQDTVNGVIHSIKYRKGGVYITLDNSVKVHFYPSRNYLYKNYFLDEFLHKGDSIIKQSANDTLFIYRNGQEYYFVLGEIINRR